MHASIGVGEEPYDLEGPFDGTADCQTAFWTYVTDADGDGLSDAHPNANFPSNIKDFWPRVYLRNVADPRYVSEAIPLPAAFGIGLPAVNTPTPATTLDAALRLAAIGRRAGWDLIGVREDGSFPAAREDRAALTLEVACD